MNQEDKKDKFPTALVVITFIIVVALAIVTTKELLTGLFLFITEGGWKWILVILGLLLIVFLLKNASGKD